MATTRRLLVGTIAFWVSVGASTVAAHPGSGIVVTRDGRVLFVAAGDSRILTIGSDGSVRAFLDDARLRLPHHLVLHSNGDLFSISDHDGVVWRITPTGAMTQVFPPPGTTSAPHLGMGGDPFTIDASGVIYGMDARAVAGRWRVIRIATDGTSATLAGSEEGHRDGRGAAARFEGLHFASMVIGPDSSLYLTDGRYVRRIDQAGVVTTLHDGTSIERAAGLRFGPDGDLYVADWSARRIVRLSADGRVLGTNAQGAARLGGPVGIAFAPDGAMHILDHDSFSGTSVWRVTAAGAERLTLVRAAGYFPRLVAFWGIGFVVPLLLVLQTRARRPKHLLDFFVWTIPAGAAIGLLWWVMADARAPGLAWARHLVPALFLLFAARGFNRLRASRSGDR